MTARPARPASGRLRVRVTGLPADVAAAVTAVRAALPVTSTSRPYPCRGQSGEVRVYLTCRPGPHLEETMPR